MTDHNVTTIAPKYMTDKGLIDRLYTEEGFSAEREEVLREILRRPHLETEYPGSHEDAHDEVSG